jgi:hypothetical protein
MFGGLSKIGIAVAYGTAHAAAKAALGEKDKESEKEKEGLTLKDGKIYQGDKCLGKLTENLSS